VKAGKPPGIEQVDWKAEQKADDRQQKLVILAAVFFAVRLWKFRFDAEGSSVDADQVREGLAIDSAQDADAVLRATEAVAQ
jgi:hypothetical protein